MGRAERRKLERRNRIEDRKGKILLSHEDISKMKREITESVTENFGAYSTEAMMTCFALANRRLYKHGLERSLRTLQYIDELMGPIIDGTKTIEDYKKELEDEIGLKIDCNVKI